ncbi:MAG TPA: DUF4160 domain-containing protein [Thermoleophilaceae bacterium]|nr:DUF4160 domain-containing protein [Thermoleophilaceae bacterium]
MPRISSFHGIVIRMFFEDHQPPHFHVDYAEHAAVVAIDTLAVVRGSIPRRQARLVRRWAALHRAELLANWERARGDGQLAPIAPLP